MPNVMCTACVKRAESIRKSFVKLGSFSTASFRFITYVGTFPVFAADHTHVLLVLIRSRLSVFSSVNFGFSPVSTMLTTKTTNSDIN